MRIYAEILADPSDDRDQRLRDATIYCENPVTFSVMGHLDLV
jgi:hypothetical protein